VSLEDLVMKERALYDWLMKRRYDFERWPCGAMLDTTVEEFRKISLIPGVVGAISHIYIQCDGQPYAGTFRGPNGENTIVFEVICDHRGSFIYSSYFCKYFRAMILSLALIAISSLI